MHQRATAEAAGCRNGGGGKHGETLLKKRRIRREKISARLSDGLDCKESLPHRQALPQSFFRLLWRAHATPLRTLSDYTLVRRQNVLALFQRYAERALSQGVPPKGLEQDFAARLQISPSMWSQIKSARPIGNKLARQIEVLCEQANGWLDEVHDDAPPSAEEKAFLALALNAWRASSAAQRRALKKQMQSAAQDAT